MKRLTCLCFAMLALCLTFVAPAFASDTENIAPVDVVAVDSAFDAHDAALAATNQVDVTALEVAAAAGADRPLLPRLRSFDRADRLLADIDVNRKGVQADAGSG